MVLSRVKDIASSEGGVPKRSKQPMLYFPLEGAFCHTPLTTCENEVGFFATISAPFCVIQTQPLKFEIRSQSSIFTGDEDVRPPEWRDMRQ